MGRARSWGVYRPLLLVVPLSALLLVTMVAAAAKPERASAWRDREITVDGFDEDWQGLTAPAKGVKIAVGFVNDADWLYICVLARDTLTRDQITGNGLIIWLDPDSGKKKTFGIRFPVGAPENFAGPPPRGRVQPVPGDQTPPPARPSDRLVAQDEVTILGPGKNEEHTVPIEHSGGIAARLATHMGALVYELRVPLKRAEHAYAVGVEPGAVLRVEMQTPEYSGPYRGPRGRGGLGGTIVIGGGRGGGIYGGYGGGAVDARALKPLDTTMIVQLAAGPR
jgi:hypothetical protein